MPHLRAAGGGSIVNVLSIKIGRAEEFADVVAFLVSSRASYVTGTAINVDGGLSGSV